jgi:copper chaperone CopZ
MSQLELAVTGMGCGACVKHVRDALSAVPGVLVQDVSIGKAVVQFDPRQSSEAVVIGALAASGYPSTKVAAASITPAPAARKGGCCGV